MSEPDRERVEDFAVAAVGMLAGARNQAAGAAPLIQILGEVGV